MDESKFIQSIIDDLRKLEDRVLIHRHQTKDSEVLVKLNTHLLASIHNIEAFVAEHNLNTLNM